jgi:hypothetical protein
VLQAKARHRADDGLRETDDALRRARHSASDCSGFFRSKIEGNWSLRKQWKIGGGEGQNGANMESVVSLSG